MAAVDEAMEIIQGAPMDYYFRYSMDDGTVSSDQKMGTILL